MTDITLQIRLDGAYVITVADLDRIDLSIPIARVELIEAIRDGYKFAVNRRADERKKQETPK